MQGEPVLELHQQLTRIIAARTRDKRLGRFLAQPVTDKNSGTITWYSNAEGPVRRLQDLGNAERAGAEARVTTIVEQISAIIEALEASDRDDQQRLALHLRAAMKHPSDADLFLVGEIGFLVAIYVLGGDWWEKFRNIFIWSGQEA